MSGSNSGRGGGVWNQIEQFINDKLSSMSQAGNAASPFLQQPDWVQNVVRDVLSRATGGRGRADSRNSGASAPTVSTEVFETHRQVIVKIKLPPKEDPRALQVLVRSDRIKLLGLPGGDPKFIPLPAPVVPRSARARYREGTLEVYARKRRRGPYVDTYVEY